MVGECPEPMVCPTIANYVVLGLYCIFAAVFVTWRTKRVYQQTVWGLVKSGVGFLSRFRWQESDSLSECYAQEYAEVRQKYCEAATATMFLTHLLVSVGLLVLVEVNIKTTSRFWFVCWKLAGFWLTLLVAVPRLHHVTRGVSFGYIGLMALVLIHQMAQQIS